LHFQWTGTPSAEVLDALMIQLVPVRIHREIVVVDNNSTDSTSKVSTGQLISFLDDVTIADAVWVQAFYSISNSLAH
jgi:hypothetical protein